MQIDAGALEKMRTPVRGKSKKKPVKLEVAAYRDLLVRAQRMLRDYQPRALPDADDVGARAASYLAATDAALPTSLDAAVQSLLMKVLGGDLSNHDVKEDLVASWLTIESPAFAVRAIVESIDTEWAMRMASRAWALLREQLAVTNEAAWKAARDEAASRFATSSVSAQCGLAYLFPEEPSWAARAAAGWLEQVKPPASAQGTTPFAGYMTLAALEEPTLQAALCEHARASTGYGQIGDFAADAACIHGERAIEPLLTVFSIIDESSEVWSWGRPSVIKIGKTLACFDAPRVNERFADLLDHRVFSTLAVDHLDRFPGSALRILAPSLGQKSKKAERRVAQLDAILRAHPELATTSGLSAATEALLVERLATLSPVAVEARDEAAPNLTELPREAWPAVLASPPWRSKAARTARPVMIGLAAPDRTPHLILDAATRRSWKADMTFMGVSRAPRSAQEAHLAKARSNSGRTEKLRFSDFADWVPLSANLFDDDLLLEMLRLPPFTSVFSLPVMQLCLDRLGEAALPGTLARFEVEPELFPLALHLDAPSITATLARAFKRPTQRTLAQRAILRFPETHVPGLVALALDEGKDAELASQALRWLAGQNRALVSRGASVLGPAVSAAIDTLLSIDPLELCPSKPPKLSDLADPSALPRVCLRDHRPLPLEAMRNLLEMLQFTSVDVPYAGLEQITAACDPASLDAFVWALAMAWDRAGGSSASAWALHALAHLGSDSVVKKLVAEIKRWPREKAKSRALLGLEVLSRMGSDVALLALDELSKKARNKDVEAKAATLLSQVAEARGLSTSDLEDRLVPTLELDAQGGRSLAIGARILSVRFDEQLHPFLVDAEGQRHDKILKQKGDESEALERAKEAFKELKGDAAAVTRALIDRLERAMCDERRWDAAAFRTLFVTHPLTQHVTRRLVWGTFEEGKLLSTFRVAEDGSFAGLDDEPFDVGEVEVGIVHPLRLDGAVISRWTERFGDYQILQPFEQLGRTVTRVVGDGEALLDRATGKSVSLGALLGGLEARGWRLARPDGDGIMDSLSRTRGGATAHLSFGPGFRPREERPERVEIGHVAFEGLLHAGEASAIAYSELVRDLAVFGLV